MPALALPAAVSIFGGMTVGAVATTTVGTLVGTAIVGAVAGAAQASLTGGDIMQGAIMGGVGGAVAGGASTLLSGTAQQGAGSLASKLAEQGAGTASEATVPMATAAEGAGAMTTAAATSAATPAIAMPTIAQTAPAMTQTAATTSQTPGLLGRIGGLIEKYPTASKVVGQTVMDAAKGLLASQAEEEERKAQLERTRLSANIGTVGGLSRLPQVNQPLLKLNR